MHRRRGWSRLDGSINAENGGEMTSGMRGEGVGGRRLGDFVVVEGNCVLVWNACPGLQESVIHGMGGRRRGSGLRGILLRVGELRGILLELRDGLGGG